MIHPVEILIIILIGLSAVDIAKRHKLGNSCRELKKFKKLTYLEEKYISEYNHFFKPQIWHWAALLSGVAAVLHRVL